MKRGKSLERRTPLERTPFHRGPSHRTQRAYESLALDLDLVAWQVDPLWPVAKLVPLRRDHYTCLRCGQPGNDPHHRYALQAGGRLDDDHRHDPERLVTLCRLCHQWVHQHPTDAAQHGWIVRSAVDCLRVPVQTWYGTALLGHDARVSTVTVKFR